MRILSNLTALHAMNGWTCLKSIEHAQLLTTQWLWTYNNDRPHTSIGAGKELSLSHLTPKLLLQTKELQWEEDQTNLMN